jgi:Rrf2 family protein
MLSMSKRADYALLALSYLAAAGETPGRLVNTKEIAEQFGIPPELLAKLLQTLAKHGLVRSHPGPTGGYRLLRRSSDITVAEVLLLIDGPLSMLQCSDGHGASCKQYQRCTIRDPLVEIESRVRALLENITLDEVSGPPPEPAIMKDYSRRTYAVGLPVHL